MRDKKRKKTHECKICHSCGVTEFHHVFYGSFRKKSEEMDLVIEICPRCHDKIHRHPKEFYWLKEQYQKDWENEHSHEAWMRIFNRNWLIN